MRRRPPKGLLGGTLELPGGPWTVEADIGPADAPFPASWRRLPGVVEQVFTHFTLRLTLYAAEVGSGPPEAHGHIWLAPETAAGAGFSSVMLKAVTHARRFIEADEDSG